MNELLDNYDLFIFDLDDTLIKTEYYHYKSWLSVLKDELGSEFYIDYNKFCSKFHSNKENNIKTYLTNELCIQDCNKIMNNKNDYYLNLINAEKHNIQLIKGAYELLTKIINNKKEFVIVSNSFKSNIVFFLELFPILKRSTKNYYREMFEFKKPNPECYLKVSGDFQNKRKVGFEDSITGIHSMITAGNIDTIFINNSNYYHYKYIKANYTIKYIIEDYCI